MKDRKDYTKMIVSFMKEKAKVVFEHTRFKYINNKDLKYLSKLNNNLSMQIWKDMKISVKEGYYDLSYRFCPFCIKLKIEGCVDIAFNNYPKCHGCFYKKNHRSNCNVANSHWTKICSKLDKINTLIPYHKNEILSNYFYKKLIKKIEGESKK
jgi:hypothetical protein